jgi:hypothetical protein
MNDPGISFLVGAAVMLVVNFVIQKIIKNRKE